LQIANWGGGRLQICNLQFAICNPQFPRLSLLCPLVPMFHLPLPSAPSNAWGKMTIGLAVCSSSTWQGRRDKRTTWQIAEKRPAQRQKAVAPAVPCREDESEPSRRTLHRNSGLCLKTEPCPQAGLLAKGGDPRLSDADRRQPPSDSALSRKTEIESWHLTGSTSPSQRRVRGGISPPSHHKVRFINRPRRLRSRPRAGTR